MTLGVPGDGRSLRAKLLRHVVLPMVLTWGVGTAIMLSVANYFAGAAFDRSMLDDAYTVAAQVRIENGLLQLNMSPREMGTLLYDQNESVYFSVRLPDDTLLAGHGALRPPPVPEGMVYRFANINFQGRELRAVSLRRSKPTEFTVVMAQTNIIRNQLLHRLLGYSAVPQVLLLGFLAIWLLRVIDRDLRPLARLQQAVELRDANDLTPVTHGAPAGDAPREVERLGGAINSMLSRLALSMDAQREFAGNVAHELRTPLAGIRAQAEYALAQQDPAIWREQLLGIARSEARASHLVDQLLALALANEAQAGLSLGEVALDGLVRETVIRFMPRAYAAGVDLGATGLDEPVTAWADPGLVEGLVANLVDNALRYGRAAEPRVTVAVERVPADEGSDGNAGANEAHAVRLSVTDNGPGLSPEDAQRLTQRGAQGPDGQKLGQGAGLGLSIVARYAELMNARIGMGPGSDGTGLCVSVTFRPGPPAAA